MQETNPTSEQSALLGEVIQRAKSQLEQMIDLNPQAMVLLERTGHVMRANRAFISLIGASGYGSIIGEELSALFPGADRSVLQSLTDHRQGLATHDIVLNLEEGRIRRLRFTVVDGGHGSEALVIIAHDITDELLQADLAARANKVEAVRALMGALMHHLNQPLTVLMIRAKLMHQALEHGTAKPEEIQATFVEIMKLTMKMAALLQKVDAVKNYVTEEYIPGLEILDLDK